MRRGGLGIGHVFEIHYLPVRILTKQSLLRIGIRAFGDIVTLLLSSTRRLVLSSEVRTLWYLAQPYTAVDELKMFNQQIPIETH